MIRHKFIIILIVAGLIGGAGFVINRVSTVLHPWGNWLLGAVLLIVIAGVGAVWWDASSKGVTNWNDFRNQLED